MPDIFISYSAKDNALARAIHENAQHVGLSVFLAELSLKPSVDWKKTILDELERSEWVFFLATPNSCASSAVMHEIGAALVLRKSFVPIRIGVPVEDLPEWIQDRQAVDGADAVAMQTLFHQVAEKIKADKISAGLVLSAIALAVWWASKK